MLQISITNQQFKHFTLVSFWPVRLLKQVLPLQFQNIAILQRQKAIKQSWIIKEKKKQVIFTNMVYSSYLSELIVFHCAEGDLWIQQHLREVLYIEVIKTISSLFILFLTKRFRAHKNTSRVRSLRVLEKLLPLLFSVSLFLFS